MALHPALSGDLQGDWQGDWQSNPQGQFQQRLAHLQSALPQHADKPNETVRATLHALWHLASGSALSVVCAQQLALPALDSPGLARLDALIARRLSGVPLAHLSQRQHFMDLEMLAGPEALIPRLETEQLGRAAATLMHSIQGQQITPAPKVLDLCCGSGNLALALAHHAPHANVWGSDVSAAAIDLAKRNASHLGLSGRVGFRVGDLFQPFDEACFIGQIDLLVCNPPYISSAKINTLPAEIQAHEPRAALDGGPLGVNLLRRFLREAPQFLRPGGWLALEVGHGQGHSVMHYLRAMNQGHTSTASASAQSTPAFEAPIGAENASGDIRVVMARLAAH